MLENSETPACGTGLYIHLFFSLSQGLQNDHKALMKEIEEGLHHVHAAAREKKKLADEHQTTNQGITVMFLVEIFFKGSQNLNPKLFVQTSWNFFFKNFVSSSYIPNHNNALENRKQLLLKMKYFTVKF